MAAAVRSSSLPRDAFFLTSKMLSWSPGAFTFNETLTSLRESLARMQLEYLCYIDQDPPKPTTPKTTIRLSRTARAIRSFSPSRQGTPGAPAVSWD